MKYNKMSYNNKLEYQECINFESNKFNDIFYCKIKTPNGNKEVRVQVSCNCFKGGNRQLNKKILCTHELTAIKELLKRNKSKC